MENDTDGTGSNIRKRALCTPVYTTAKIARSVCDEYMYNCTMSTNKIAGLFMANSVYLRQPGILHFGAVKRELKRMVQKTIAEDMYLMGVHMDLLRSVGHKVELITYGGK